LRSFFPPWPCGLYLRRFSRDTMITCQKRVGRRSKEATCIVRFWRSGRRHEERPGEFRRPLTSLLH
jgi:hypothetical protein